MIRFRRSQRCRNFIDGAIAATRHHGRGLQRNGLFDVPIAVTFFKCDTHRNVEAFFTQGRNSFAQIIITRAFPIQDEQRKRFIIHFAFLEDLQSKKGFITQLPAVNYWRKREKRKPARGSRAGK